MRSLERWIGGALLSACALVAMAALPPGLSARIEALPAPLRAQVEQRAERVAAMAPSAREQLRARQAHWDALPAAERARLREHWQAWTVLAPTQQQRLRRASVAFASLPPGQQRALRDSFGQLSLDARRGWLLGPEVGAAWMQLQPLLMQVPAEQREPLLAVLQSMSAGQLQDLAVLAHRTPPQERSDLREGLLATSPAYRAAWLQLRLER